MKSLTAALLCGLVATTAAQPISPTEGRIYVAVADGKGAPVSPRESDAFYIWENATSRAVTTAVPATEAPAIVVIVHGFGREETLDARNALTQFLTVVRNASPNARVSIIGDVTTTKLTDITQDSEALNTTAKRFAVSAPNLRLFEAVDDAAAALSKEPSSRRIIVTLTNALRYDVEERSAALLAESVKNAGASLWSIDVALRAGDRAERSGIEVPKLLNEWSIVSGGVHESVFGTRALPDTMTRFANLMLSQYEVRFARPALKGNAKLQVGVAGRPGEKVIAPQWFVSR